MFLQGKMNLALILLIACVAYDGAYGNPDDEGYKEADAEITYHDPGSYSSSSSGSYSSSSSSSVHAYYRGSSSSSSSSSYGGKKHGSSSSSSSSSYGGKKHGSYSSSSSSSYGGKKHGSYSSSSSPSYGGKKKKHGSNSRSYGGKKKGSPSSIKRCKGTLWCWNCKNAANDDECFANGEWRKCSAHCNKNFVCIFSYRTNPKAKGGIRTVSRGCKNKRACRNLRKKNSKFCKDKRCNVKCVECHTDGKGARCCQERKWTPWGAWSACHQKCGPEPKERTRKCPSSECPQSPSCHGIAKQKADCGNPCCPVNGCWGSWDSWSTCNRQGRQYRSRNCDDPAPACGGNPCSGEHVEIRKCKAKCYKENGGWGPWTPWSDCDCKKGKQWRTRKCDHPKPRCGGKCPGRPREDRKCKPLNVDGKWTNWSHWGKCSKKCGIGKRCRSRSCTNPKPQCYGRKCPGRPRECEKCGNDHAKKVNGGWSEWCDWGPCSVTCGKGTRGRYRACNNPEPHCGGHPCDGTPYESEKCSDGCCAVDGGWGSWKNWGTCSATCGQGFRTRSRKCNDPRPSVNPKCPGKPCYGDDDDIESCSLTPCCKVDGGWTSWTSWQKDVTCGYGIKTRYRECVDPAPSCGGNGCPGSPVREKAFDGGCCAVDGGWTPWSTWCDCSVDCGIGTRDRVRSCRYPIPQCGGQYCKGPRFETEKCQVKEIEGVLSTWSEWVCGASCGITTQFRNRTCDPPSPEYKYPDCEVVCDAPLEETAKCNAGCCPEDGGWAAWSSWTKCTKKCGGGVRERWRKCTDPPPKCKGKPCRGPKHERETCNGKCCPKHGYWRPWKKWSSCSVSCGEGTRTRKRDCYYPSPKCKGNACDGDAKQTEKCGSKIKVDGVWTPWDDWTTCTVTCGGGQRTRNRTCNDPTPMCGGLACHGDPEETEDCNKDCCKEDGEWDAWGQWGSCTKTCGGGTQTRDRECIFPKPDCKGKPCSRNGDSYEARGCNDVCCPVDGGWSTWSGWDNCTKPCGGGSRGRWRSCSDPPPKCKGKKCQPEGDTEETEKCNTQCCKEDGKWTPWSPWDKCDRTCGGGKRNRWRKCKYTTTDPKCQGNTCEGDSEQTEKCNTDCCKGDGNWGQWKAWSTCSVTCGFGKWTRRRYCKYPNDKCKGEPCIGSNEQTGTCGSKITVDGVWTPWDDWTTCTVTCGGGERTRNRTCNDPTPMCGGISCDGEPEEKEYCNTKCCPVNGGWTRWTSYDNCTKPCGGGTKSRWRTCTKPKPRCHGDDCPGRSEETTSCNTKCCPVNGGWTQWTSYSNCTEPCGGGTKSRWRTCTYPKPKCYGKNCTGLSEETTSCNTQCCKENGYWGQWKAWSSCSVTCGFGKWTRRRYCIYPNDKCKGDPCPGPNEQTGTCGSKITVDGVWTPWDEWTTCTVTCGKGERTRNRTCNDPTPMCGGIACYGDPEETETCNPECCPVDGGWTKWSDWGKCTKSCGGGRQSRTRACTYPPPSCYGAPCPGKSKETRSCNTKCCPVNGGWTPWSFWNPCSKTCGGGSRQRYRECTYPPPSCYGEDCNGPKLEKQICNKQCCPRNGGWSSWSGWSNCTKSCGYYHGGVRSRWRKCNNPTPECYGKDCPGPVDETETCNKKCCPIKGYFGKWYHWSKCDVTCGYGKQKRIRKCYSPHKYCPATCYGPVTETRECDAGCCPHYGSPGPWSSWSCELDKKTSGYDCKYKYRYRVCKDDDKYSVDQYRYCPPTCYEDLYEERCSYDHCTVCVCRLAADPWLYLFDSVTKKNADTGSNFVLTKYGYVDSNACRFKATIYNKGKADEYLEVEADEGKFKAHCKSGYAIDYITPSYPPDACNPGYDRYVGNIHIFRHNEFVVIKDKRGKCKYSIGYVSDGSPTRCTIVADASYGPYLIGKCGMCGGD